VAKVTELGYMGLSVSDLDAWRDFAGGIIGMEVLDESEGDRIYLRMDRWHHRIVLHDDGGDDLAYLGWRVTGPMERAEIAQQLEDADISYEVASDADAAERRVLGLLKLHDPGGNPTEIFYGPQVDTATPFHPGRPMFGKFVTGDQGLGHLILREDDIEAATRFYRILGFVGGVEYKFALPDGGTAMPVFMHCNDRHHSVAFGFGPSEKRINHLMVEYTELNDLGLAHDLVRDRQIDITLRLGKHSNDEAFTFYCANPSGWLWEPGWAARTAPKQQEHYVRDLFGHDNEVKGYGLDLALR
jgi:2,3-dihydroxybiphenyl 1,2-dioxygenase